MRGKSSIWMLVLGLLFFAGCALKPSKATFPSSPGRVESLDAAAFSSPGELLINDLGMEFVTIPSGSFDMGSPEDEVGRDGDERRHRVELTSGFLLQRTEVTQGQWTAVMGENPSYFLNCGEECPVEQVSWEDVQEFIGRLNGSDPAWRYDLPTEAQWEYAARAGSTTALVPGDLSGTDLFHDPVLGGAGWYVGNSDEGTHPVAGKKPNSWGLYDMHGNVQEWCRDWRDIYPFNEVTDPAGPESGWSKIRRGGSWNLYTRFCRSASRSWASAYMGDAFTGLRLVAYPKPAPLDGDGDGVVDGKDECPGTPSGVRVDADGCPSDSDGDGVADHLDDCPDTPKGIAVDENGCPLKLTLKIEFDTDRAEIKPRYHAEIEKAAIFIGKYPGYRILVAGHTDSDGSDDYNLKLSERRALAVYEYLVEKFGIDYSVLSARGYGESQPIVGNDTDERRQRNRRVEVLCCVVIPD